MRYRLLTLLLLFASSCVTRDDSTRFSIPDEPSDELYAGKESGSSSSARVVGGLTADPRNDYGRFSNGFRYILRENAKPQGEVALRLHIRTGALNESVTQNGLAHFIEHMAYNGTTHYKAGELIPRLESYGMRFGHDSNASTGHTDTIYMLDMPDTETETIEEALTILADFAYGVQFPPEEIEKERPIILNERQARIGPGQRLRDQIMKGIFPESRVALHDIIGKNAVIEKAPRFEFTNYYDTWYRPDLMTLVVVGDIDVEKLLPKVKARFGSESFEARGPLEKSRPSGIQPQDKSRVLVLSDPQLQSEQISVLSVVEPPSSLISFEEYRRRTIASLAYWIIERRLQTNVQRGTSALLDASIDKQRIVADGWIVNAGGTLKTDNWELGLGELISEIKRALDHGFTEKELQLARRELLNRAERFLETESTLDSRQLAGALIRSTQNRDVPIAAKDNLALTREALRGVQPIDVAELFASEFDVAHWTYLLILSEQTPKPSREEVLAAADRAWSAITRGVAEDEVTETGELIEPEPGRSVTTRIEPGLGIATVELSNGAILHHREMDQRDQQVLVSISTAGGSIEEDAGTRGFAAAASLMNATSTIDSNALRDLFVGRDVQVSGQFTTDLMTVTISSSPEDLELGFQIAYNLIVDGVVEEATLYNWRTEAIRNIAVRDADPRTQLFRAFHETVLQSDPRFAELTADDFASLNARTVTRWARRILGRTPFEVAIVGEISLSQAKELAERYVASLPESTKPMNWLSPLKSIELGTGPFHVTKRFRTQTDQAMVEAGYLGADYNNKRDRRLMTVVSFILTARMIRTIREEKQLVYSIGAAHQPAMDIPGTGRLTALAPCDPAQADELATEILAICDEFAKNGPSDAELAATRRQIDVALERQLEEPGFWLRELGSLRYRGSDLDDLKRLREIYGSFTKEELQEVAQKYFVPEKQIRFVAIPELSAQ